MKTIGLFTALICFSLNAFAQKQVVEGSDSVAFATFLKGKTLSCSASDKKDGEKWSKGYFPLKIRARKLTGKKVELEINSANGERFGTGGDELFPVEKSATWFIIEAGDDGRSYLFINRDAEFASITWGWSGQSGSIGLICDKE